MYRIGLTGGIASGKSTVSGILAELGAYIIDADKTAHKVMSPGNEAYKKVVKKFGQGVINKNGEIDREKLGALIFSVPEYKTELDALVHPIIKEDMLRQETLAKQQGVNVTVWDVPLLIETQWHNVMDEVWVVYVNEKTQLLRLMKRNNLSEEQAQQRIHSQLLLKDKLQFADIVIDNSNSVDITRQQVINAWRGVIRRLKSTATE